MEIKNLNRLRRKLEHLAKSRLESPNAIGGESVIVGYTANYAAYVHENLEGRPNPPRSDAQRKAMFASIRENEEKGHTGWQVGESKFLEKAARRLDNNGTLSGVITKAMLRGTKLQQALYLAGLRIQRASQKLVPVDTGNLRASAFTRKE